MKTNLLFFGDGDNSEFFRRTIPSAILPFSYSSHHDRLRSSRNFESYKHHKKFPTSELSFFALYIKTKLGIFGLWAYHSLS